MSNLTIESKYYTKLKIKIKLKPKNPLQNPQLFQFEFQIGLESNPMVSNSTRYSSSPDGNSVPPLRGSQCSSKFAHVAWKQKKNDNRTSCKTMPIPISCHSANNIVPQPKSCWVRKKILPAPHLEFPSPSHPGLKSVNSLCCKYFTNFDNERGVSTLHVQRPYAPGEIIGVDR